MEDMSTYLSSHLPFVTSHCVYIIQATRRFSPSIDNHGGDLLAFSFVRASGGIPEQTSNPGRERQKEICNNGIVITERTSQCGENVFLFPQCNTHFSSSATGDIIKWCCFFFFTHHSSSKQLKNITEFSMH